MAIVEGLSVTLLFCNLKEKVKVLFGLLLFLLALNGVESQCNYYQNIEAGQTYYIYNPEFPNLSRGKNYCTWEMKSSKVIKINCSIEMSNNCYQNRLSVKFAGSDTFTYCGYNIFVREGINPIVQFDSQNDSQGSRFLCEIKTVDDNYCQCGWKKVTRIVGGKETGINEYPMMCGLMDITNKMIYCGCTIISEQYVLTAAHCIQDNIIYNTGIFVGKHDTTTGRDTKATELFKLIGCKIHPWYQSNANAYYDVAVCKIAGSIKYSAEVGPVCLPFRHRRDTFADSTVTALGWGFLEFGGSKATKLQKVDLDVITYQKCKYYYANVNDNNMCTYSPGKDTCQMDSGGPLLWQNPMTHNLVLAGITSSGVGCASDNPAVAMRTGAFIDWIISITPDARYCQVE
ncbi:PREDICTED: venom serine protease-like isoform X2 [Wasmannia auropunctata]|uniref:venom serine protease-like isoform X2 n=1 Tax=Wasmannia auropunctata TaxID=64793 RepID=UPI0005EE0247|nr:PREDICTED: venom serine protease-like isoform X2 [Wasmannia auropunctata]